MKRKVCGLIIMLGFFINVEIIVGAYLNEWWCFPIAFGMWGAGKIGGFYKY